MNFWDNFIYDLGIDLGTATTLVYIKGKGLMIREPSVVARQRKKNFQGDNVGKILAVGEEAKKMLGKTPESIEVIRPLRNGVISDFDATREMLSYYIKKIHENRGILPKIGKPRIVIGIPNGVTEVERKAVADAAVAAGAREVFLVEEAMAAAIGAGFEILDSRGKMIVDIGGGTAEIAVVSFGGIVANKSLRTAGDEMNEAIVAFLKQKYKLLVGELTAEKVKIEIGSVAIFKKEKQMVVRGKGMVRGLPQSVKVNSLEIREALAPVVWEIIGAVADTLDETPPELVADIVRDGIVMAGGGSLLFGIDQALSRATKIPVKISPAPITCVAKGCGKLLEDDNLLKKVALAR